MIDGYTRAVTHEDFRGYFDTNIVVDLFYEILAVEECGLPSDNKGDAEDKK